MAGPMIVVTGPIAGGKTTVADVMAARGGSHLEADLLAHRALTEDSVIGLIREEFGPGVFDAAGQVSRAALGAAVFRDGQAVGRLNAIVKPAVTRIVEEEVERASESSAYIVLDAVLFFEYKFVFKPGMTVLVTAPRAVRLERLLRRDGLGRKEALFRIEGQRYLEDGWKRAEVTLDTSGSLEEVLKEAERIRDMFISEHVS